MIGTWNEGKKHGIFEIPHDVDSDVNEIVKQIEFKDDKMIRMKIGKILINEEEEKITELYEDDTKIRKYSNDSGHSTKWKYGVKIGDEEINIISENKMLNSNNIQFYNQVLKIKHEDEYWNEKNDWKKFLRFERIFSYPVNFLSSLTLDNLVYEKNNWNFEKVKGITRKFNEKGFLIFDVYDRLMFVVNSKNHWFLAEINCNTLEKFEFRLYDSVSKQRTNKNTKDLPVIKILIEYCKAEIHDKCCSKYLEKEGEHQCDYKKRLKNAEYNICEVSKQQNGYDCGMFVCGYLKDIYEQKEIGFSQGDVKPLREFMENLYIQNIGE